MSHKAVGGGLGGSYRLLFSRFVFAGVTLGVAALAV
jgi:hypothetical protein